MPRRHRPNRTLPSRQAAPNNQDQTEDGAAGPVNPVSGLEEIVVTAQKRSSGLPMFRSRDAIDAQALVESNQLRLEDYSAGYRPECHDRRFRHAAPDH